MLMETFLFSEPVYFRGKAWQRGSKTDTNRHNTHRLFGKNSRDEFFFFLLLLLKRPVSFRRLALTIARLRSGKGQRTSWRQAASCGRTD